jgi:4-aminobutyrate aminotransferase/(S)-3-amino-2-methylpropionate transaminase
VVAGSGAGRGVHPHLLHGHAVRRLREVARRSTELTPGDHEEAHALFNSGAEAVENAVKIARVFTPADAVVVFDHAYHGRTNLTMAMTAKNMPYKHGFGPFAGEVYRAPMSYPFRDGRVDGEQAAARAIDVIDKQVGAANLACVVIEPIQGEGGFVVPAGLPAGAGRVVPGERRRVRRRRDPDRLRRTGDWFACDHEGVVPTWSPRQGHRRRPAAGRRHRPRRDHGRRARRRPRRHLRRQPGRLRRRPRRDRDDRDRRPRRPGPPIGDQMLERLHRPPGARRRIGDVRGRGAMIAVELVKPGTTEPDADLTKRVAKAATPQGVVVLTCGTYGNVLRFLPPSTTACSPCWRPRAAR